MKKILLVLLMLLLSGCTKGAIDNNEIIIDDEKTVEELDEEESSVEEPMEEEEKEIMVEIILEDNRKIRIELYKDKAPITVENFLKLVDSNYYDETVFHRIIRNFMIQTGGYKVDGQSLEELPHTESIKGEFASNGFTKNDINHTPGVISMARTSDKNSATGQFFICTSNATHLNGEYAAFGKVVDEESMSVVMDLNNAPTTNVGGGFSDFAYPVIRIKTIKRV